MENQEPKQDLPARTCSVRFGFSDSLYHYKIPADMEVHVGRQYFAETKRGKAKVMVDSIHEGISGKATASLIGPA